MLKLEDIVYPIRFKTHAQPFVEFSDRYNGKWADGSATGLTLEHFIHQHNVKNPTNHPYPAYSYVMPEAPEAPKAPKALEAAGGVCRVEDMPLGATLTAVQLDDGDWLEMRIIPRRIEVDADVVTFLLHAHYQPNLKKSRFGGEISISRDALVRWEK